MAGRTFIPLQGSNSNHRNERERERDAIVTAAAIAQARDVSSKGGGDNDSRGTTRSDTAGNDPTINRWWKAFQLQPSNGSFKDPCHSSTTSRERRQHQATGESCWHHPRHKEERHCHPQTCLAHGVKPSTADLHRHSATPSSCLRRP